MQNGSDVTAARQLCSQPEALHLHAVSCAREAAEATGAERNRLLEEAAQAFQAALAFEPSARTGLMPGVGSFSSWSGLGAVRLAQGRRAAAVACFSRALLAHPGDRDARLGLAELQIAGGRAAGAMVVLERLLDERPDGWVLAAAASRAINSSASVAGLLRRAGERAAGRGYVAPHRAVLAAQLAAGR
jgi:predicted Zn-dependent protease